MCESDHAPEVIEGFLPNLLCRFGIESVPSEHAPEVVGEFLLEA